MANADLVLDYSAIENRLDALEARHAFQDDVIEQLNSEITVHQAEIAELKQQLQLMATRLKEGEPSQILKAEEEPPPPHY